MKSKVVIMVIALFFGLANVLMSEDLPSTPKSTGPESLIPPNATFFIGKWAGQWEHMSGRQDANILVKKNEDGKYHCTYSWDFFTALKGKITPGSTSGIISFENENTFVLKKKDYTVTFIKKDENTLKGRWDRIGPTEVGKRPFFEGVFKRVN